MSYLGLIKFWNIN